MPNEQRFWRSFDPHPRNTHARWAATWGGMSSESADLAARRRPWRRAKSFACGVAAFALSALISQLVFCALALAVVVAGYALVHALMHL
jgi:hypothetical protein